MSKLRPHPHMTQSIPEMRHGTRTYRGYMRHCFHGNVPAFSKLVRSTPRQNKKVLKHFIACKSSDPQPQPCGCVMRAIFRDMVANASGFDDIPF